MCGRYSQSQPLTRYAHALDPEWNPEKDGRPSTWNLAPGQNSWALISGGEEILAAVLKWGLLPSWADKDGAKPINAKVETADTKPYFRRAWKSGRCLIPADGFYEWTEKPKVGKQPWFIHRKDDVPVLFAGLWEHNPHSGDATFAILTMATDGEMKVIHDRKPVMLDQEEALRWIDPMLKPAEIRGVANSAMHDDRFAWHKVSTMVNNPRNDGPEPLNPT